MAVLKDLCPTCGGPVVERRHSGRNGRGSVFIVWTEYSCVNDPDHLPEEWKPR